MDLKSQAGLAGLLTGFASSLQEIQEKQNQQKLANQRRTEVEQFQIGERENARAISQENRTQAQQDKEAARQNALSGFKTLLQSEPPATYEEAQLRASNQENLDKEAGGLPFSQWYLASQQKAFKKEEPTYANVSETHSEKGEIWKITYRRNTNPNSEGYGEYLPDPDNPDKPLSISHDFVSGATLWNTNHTGKGGSSLHLLDPEVNKMAKDDFDKAAATLSQAQSKQQELNTAKMQAAEENRTQGGISTATQKKLDGIEKEVKNTQDAHAARLKVYQDDIDDAINNNPEFSNAATVTDAMEKAGADKDKAKAAQMINEAYMKTKKIDDSDYLMLKHWYESRFAEVYPTGYNEAATGTKKKYQIITQ